MSWFSRFAGNVTGANAAQIQEDASNKAVDRGVGYLNSANRYNNRRFREGQDFLQTGTEQGASALQTGQEGGLAALMAGQGQAEQALSASPNRLADLLSNPNSFQQDPGYQFRLQQGEDAIMRSAAARGGRMGGDTLKALLEHGQGLASQEFGNAYNRAAMADQADMGRAQSLAGLFSGTGSQAAGIHAGTGSQLGQMLYGSGQNLAGLGMQAADNRIGIANAKAGLAMAPVQFAGGAEQANANFLAGGLAGLTGRLADIGQKKLGG